MNAGREPAIWFLTVRTGSGTDVFTERLTDGLRKRGLRAEITWLPLRAEYAPWTVPVPAPPAWVNVVHVNTWLHSRFLPKHLPVVATLHHSVHHPDLDTYKGLPRRLYHRYWIRMVERQTLQRVNVVVAVSKFAAETARKTLLDRSMQVIFNGVDTERFRPPAQRAAHATFRLLYVGKWVPLKGVDLLAPIMRELGNGFELCYTGGKAAERNIKHMLPIMYNIGRLHGEDAVITAMQDADAFLFPSRSEGFPLAVVEAMACGLPVIAARGSSLTEAVEDNRTGILCGRDNVTDFVSACRQLAQDNILRTRMQAAARTRAVNEFSLINMIDAYSVIYATATGKNSDSGVPGKQRSAS